MLKQAFSFVYYKSYVFFHEDSRVTQFLIKLIQVLKLIYSHISQREESNIYSSVFSPLYKAPTAVVSFAFSVDHFSMDLTSREREYRKTKTVVHPLKL